LTQFMSRYRVETINLRKDEQIFLNFTIHSIWK